MKDKLITIIGGSGFVGTNLCKLLASQGLPFEIIDLKASKSFSNLTKIADVRNLDSLEKNITGNIVVNLAAVHRDDVENKQDYYDTNVNGMENVIKVCEKRNISKIIFTSSVAVYGFTNNLTGENGKINPFNEYGSTKYLAEERLRSWLGRKKNERSLIIIRPTVIFGEGNRGNVYNLLKQIASGKFIMIGAGDNIKSIAYVKNVVEFIYQCIKSDLNYGLFNYVDTPDMNMLHLCNLVRDKIKKRRIKFSLPMWIGIMVGFCFDLLSKLTKRNFPISSIRVKKFCASSHFSSSKERLKGFKPPLSLSKALDLTIQNEIINPDPGSEIFYTE